MKGKKDLIKIEAREEFDSMIYRTLKTNRISGIISPQAHRNLRDYFQCVYNDNWRAEISFALVDNHHLMLLDLFADYIKKIGRDTRWSICICINISNSNNNIADGIRKRLLEGDIPYHRASELAGHNNEMLYFYVSVDDFVEYLI